MPWLLKTEPGTYSIDHLAKDLTTGWDGVRNYQARNLMRDEMRLGDGVFLYHSSCAVPGIVGIATVSREAYPDVSALDPSDHHYDPKATPADPRWVVVDVTFVRKLSRPLPLEELKRHPGLAGMTILKTGNRLSVTRVTPAEWDAVLGLEAA